MFKNRLKAIRKSMNLTQEEFGELGFVTSKSQNLYESGLRVPNINYLEALAKSGVDIGDLLTGIPTDMNTLSDNEKEVLQNYRLANSMGQQVLLTVSRSLVKSDDSSDDQKPGSEDDGLSDDNKQSDSGKKSKVSNLMNIVREMALHRTVYYFTKLTISIMLSIIGFVAIGYVMMLGGNFNAPEYNWLAITAYIVMNVGLVAILSKFIIHRFSLLCEKDEELES